MKLYHPLTFVCAGLVASAAIANDTDVTAQVDLNTGTGAVTITTNQSTAPTADWLATAGDVAQGTLPPIDPDPQSSGWTQRASYLTGNHWLASTADRTLTHDITVTVPATQHVAVTGEILRDEVSGDTREVQFRFDGPTTSLGIFAGTYDVETRAHGDLTLRTYFQADEADLSDRFLTASGTYIDRFAEQIGPYPYTDFSVVSAPIPVGLGFAGLTYIGEDILPHSYMTGRSLAHEILHSWWGNKVLVDYTAGNWSEGLTTFMADYGFAEDEGPQAALQMRLEWMRALDLITAEDRRPLTAFRSASHTSGRQGEGYGKAAMVFHMLRMELGPEAFYAGLRTFYAQNQGRRATWVDLQTAFESQTTRDLQEFFAQWTTRASLPEIFLDGARAEAANAVTLSVRQSEPVYDLLVPVVIETSAGQQTAMVRLDQAEQSVTLQADAPALSVQIDPAFDIVRHPAMGELSPTLSAIFALSDLNAMVVGPSDEIQAQAKTTIQDMLNFNLHWDAETGAHDADLVFGPTDAVAARFTANTGRIFPHAQSGAARAWLDTDASGRITAYLSADDIAGTAAEMRFLGYYGSKSYVSFENGSGLDYGTLPAQHGALRMRVTQ